MGHSPDDRVIVAVLANDEVSVAAVAWHLVKAVRAVRGWRARG